MAKDPSPPRPPKRPLLTGTAQPVANSVERAMGYLKGRPEPARPASKERKSFKTKRAQVDGEDEPPAEPVANDPQLDGEDEPEEA